MNRFGRILSLLTNYYVLRRTPTFVYSMRRTGTVSLLNSIKASNVFVIGTHNLYPDLSPEIRVSGSGRWAMEKIIRPRKPAKFISLVRNPFATMASVFAKTSFDAAIARGEADEYARQQRSAEELGQQFIADYLESGRYREQLDWFDVEYKPALGIDVYQYPFDKQQGFVRIDEGPYSALILKTELDDASKAEIVGDFLGLPDFQMLPADEVTYTTYQTGFTPGMPATQAPYSAEYERLKSGLTIPDKYWENMVNAPFTQHFLTAEEIAASRAKYAGSPSN
jgi:hypothetical protein